MITSPAVRRVATTVLRLVLVGLLLIPWAGLPHVGYSAPAAINWYVSKSGNDSNSCTAAQSPCEHIQTAIDRAASGDTINITAGTYGESLIITDFSLTLKGQSAATTFLDGALQPVLTIARGNASSMTILVSDVTIQNGQAGLGGGISVENNIYLTVSNSNIVSNTATLGGGGIFNQGVLILNNVTLRHNIANTNEGGGIWNTGSINMTGVTVVDNNAPRGGGISSVNTLTVTNSVFNGNTALGQYGGAIYNRSDLSRLTLINSVVSGNQSIGTDGGGIYNDGLFISSGSVISGNLALGNGGGVFNNGSGRIVFTAVTFNDNRALSNGGGLFNNGEATAVQLYVNHNTSGQAGGGLQNDAAGKLNLASSTVVTNTASNGQGGGIGNLGVLTVTQSSLSDNFAAASQGGGLYNNNQATVSETSVRNNTAILAGGGLYNTAAGQLSIKTSSVVSNTVSGVNGGGGINNLGGLVVDQSALIYNVASASQGGGLKNAGAAQLANVTVSDNSATTGGGIYNSSGTLAIQFSTISYNSAPALNRISGSVSVSNSLLMQAITSTACSGTITSADFNMDGGNSCGFAQAHDRPNTNPQLGPLRDNGGNSLTRSIGFGSPAQDTALDPCSLTVDQRGIARPQFDVCDRGAYEVAGYSNPSPIDIGANQCITSLLTINDQFAVGRLLAGVNLTYGDRADLTIRLLAPGTAKARLLGPAANSGQNLDTLFDDSAAQSVPSGDQNIASPFYENVYRPATPLQQFVGAPVRGTWKLEVCNSGLANGTLNRWALVIPEISAFKAYMPLIRRSK